MINDGCSKLTPCSTLASERPGPDQRRVAATLCWVALVATIACLPWSDRQGPLFAAFVSIDQTSLVIAYAMSAWVLSAQFRRGRSLPLLLIAGGTLYTAAIVLLQFLSFPGIVVPGRLFGAGPETTTWLWTFWHLGPPVCALAYAATSRGADTKVFRVGEQGVALAAASALALALAVATALVSTYGLAWLPHQVSGDDYRDLTWSGVGPVVLALACLALVVVFTRTRGRRSVLELWIIVSLVLLVLDNVATLAGGVRATIGWYVGRTEALLSAFSILWAYLHEVDALRARAEQAADDVVRAEAALRQSQKMEAIGRLTGGVAHDFNNLLMIISSGFEAIRRLPDDRTRVLKMADAGLEAVQRGSRLTRQLLTFARRESLNPETLNANASLLAFEPLVRRALGEAVELEITLDPTLHPTRIDRGEFEAAMLNLVVNARDAVATQGGRILISSRNDVPGENMETPVAEKLRPGEYVVISVSDNGAGMDGATRARVFEPFFTTKEFGKGSGLGLSQVYGFARSAGGNVDIVSAVGRGTTVEVWLPRAENTSAAGINDNGPASQLRRAEAGETILVVEDEPFVLAAVSGSLADLGYEVLKAQTASEALDILRRETRIDILFSDVVMPGGMNGLQLAVEASRVRPGIRTLLTSGYTDDALTGQHGVPADLQVLAKPYGREELASRLKIAARL